jgi:hypothetical protein
MCQGLKLSFPKHSINAFSVKGLLVIKLKSPQLAQICIFACAVNLKCLKNL